MATAPTRTQGRGTEGWIRTPLTSIFALLYLFMHKMLIAHTQTCTSSFTWNSNSPFKIFYFIFYRERGEGEIQREKHHSAVPLISAFIGWFWFGLTRYQNHNFDVSEQHSNQPSIRPGLKYSLLFPYKVYNSKGLWWYLYRKFLHWILTTENQDLYLVWVKPSKKHYIS